MLDDGAVDATVDGVGVEITGFETVKAGLALEVPVAKEYGQNRKREPLDP